MSGSLIEKILGLFGKKDAQAPAAVGPSAAKRDPKQPTGKQVFEGRAATSPEWCEGVEGARLIEVIEEHVVCRFKPHLEYKKIFTTRRGIDGNLEAEYEGLAADCGATKNFGLQVAQRDGYVQAYRYVDLNQVLRCCCDIPRKCYFHQCAAGQEEDVGKAHRRVGD